MPHVFQTCQYCSKAFLDISHQADTLPYLIKTIKVVMKMIRSNMDSFTNIRLMDSKQGDISYIWLYVLEKHKHLNAGEETGRLLVIINVCHCHLFVQRPA